MRKLRCFLLILIINPFLGCGLGYYLHLAKGQLNIVSSTVNLEEIHLSTQDSTIKQKLILVDSLLIFAKNIGLKTEKNFKSYYDTKGNPVSWNISASPPYAFEAYLWRFPIVGFLPYKGFFDKTRAEEEYYRLKNLNYDVQLTPVSAYSTLGYFSDPLLSTTLSLPVGNLTELILHELTHSTVYFDGMTDFNESLASFVGRKGAEEFLNQQFGPNSEYIENLKVDEQDSKRFRSFIENVVDRLDSLYNTETNKMVILSKREKIFNEEKFSFSKTLKNYKNKNYENFLKWEINNARLLSYKRYNSGMPNFETVFYDCDQSLKSFISLAVNCSIKKRSSECINETFKMN